MMVVPHEEQVPFMARRPFLVVISWALMALRGCFSFTQKPSNSTLMPPLYMLTAQDELAHLGSTNRHSIASKIAFDKA